jgi:hypothetical protein
MWRLMPADYLHNHPQFADLIRIAANERSIAPALVEKDYWIMHACMHGRAVLATLLSRSGVYTVFRDSEVSAYVAKNDRLLLLRPRCHESAGGWLAVA